MIIALSAPPRAGKTTALDYLVQHRHVNRMSIGDQIKGLAHELAGQPYPEQVKDTPLPQLADKTPRDLYIAVGEIDEVIHDIWVRRMFQAQYQGPDELHVIESVGKQFQVTALCRLCASANDGFVLVNIHRNGVAWNDNRTLLRDVLPALNVDNNGPPAYMYGQLDDLVDGINALRHIRTMGQYQALRQLESA